MKEYFKEHEREVLDMVTFKWDDKRAREIAEEEGRLRTLCDLVKDGILSNMDAAKRAGMSLEEFTKAIAML